MQVLTAKVPTIKINPKEEIVLILYDGTFLKIIQKKGTFSIDGELLYTRDCDPYDP